MDWELLYNWLEQTTGVSYDLNEDIESISGDTAFIEPYYWSMKINMILDDLGIILEAIDDNSSEAALVLDLSPGKIKDIISEDYIMKLANVINSVKKRLGMSITPIKDIEDVLENTLPMGEMILACSSFTLEELQKRNWFVNFDDQYENLLSEVLEMHKNDLIDIHQTIETIRESLTEDDDDMDMDMDEDDE